MNKLKTSKECFNASMEVLDLIKGIQSARIRDILPDHPLLVSLIAEARNAVDNLATVLEKIQIDRGEADL